ncbi:MAG: translation initiation factor IF-3 [Candidatus Omnitrophica bacterium]|nr:translation initiation factor IF-3 [Candidatus Omnitrophota bacterium]MDD5429466.1 translation initiation factor IF-3 [Candidatus Omnitrophota bacterium]
MKYVRVNQRILAKTLRVIGPEGEQLGVFPRDIGLKKAEEQGLDLVEVAPQANPPVCRIIDFSKYKYEQEKREKEVKKHQKQLQLKELRISPRIDEHDYEVKLKHAKEFLGKHHKVRVRMFFRGREIAHKEIGRRVIDKMIKDVESVGRVDREPHMLGKTLVLILSPK